MTDDMELHYERGGRAAWLNILDLALRHLYDDPVAKAAQWASEREAAIAALRSVCEDHGDNDWLSNLHLADIIEKHLARHL